MVFFQVLVMAVSGWMYTLHMHYYISLFMNFFFLFYKSNLRFHVQQYVPPYNYLASWPPNQPVVRNTPNTNELKENLQNFHCKALMPSLKLLVIILYQQANRTSDGKRSKSLMDICNTGSVMVV